MKDSVTLAAYHLGQLYRNASYNLSQALRHTGIRLSHACPRVVSGQPHSVEGPHALAAMRHHVQSTGLLFVSSDFSDSTIYEVPADNHWFRFVHDMGHLLYGCDFDYAGESKLHPLLWQWLATDPQFFALTNDQQRWVRAVYWADTQGQTDYFEKYGEFPLDQRAFVLAKAQEYYYAQA